MTPILLGRALVAWLRKFDREKPSGAQRRRELRIVGVWTSHVRVLRGNPRCNPTALR